MSKDKSKKTLTKREVVVRVASKTGIVQQDVATVLQHSLDCIVEAIAAGRHVEFREFGVFEVVTRKPRVGRNPNQPEKTIAIPARKVVKFKPGKKMRDSLRA
ncbi:MAG: HU family DNA-binding protein [Kiritimatiellia bacterium]|jgi:integration host factor subunit beta